MIIASIISCSLSIVVEAFLSRKIVFNDELYAKTSALPSWLRFLIGVALIFVTSALDGALYYILPSRIGELKAYIIIAIIDLILLSTSLYFIMNYLFKNVEDL